MTAATISTGSARASGYAIEISHLLYALNNPSTYSTSQTPLPIQYSQKENGSFPASSPLNRKNGSQIVAEVIDITR